MAKRLKYQQYKLKNYRILRDNVDQRAMPNILIVNLRNLNNVKNPMEREFTLGNKFFSHDYIQEYFLQILNKEDLPYHYYVEKIANDYTIQVGSPFITRSWWIDELVSQGLLNPKFKNSIVVAVAEDWSVEIPDRKLFQVLSHRLLSPIIRNYRMELRDVVMFDDVVNWKLYDRLENSDKMNYQFKSMDFFDYNQLKFELIHYKK